MSQPPDPAPSAVAATDPLAPTACGAAGARTAAFRTFGCKVNQYETQAVREQLAAQGYAEVPFGDAADVTILNTCAVTGEASRQARQAVRRARRSSPAGRLIVTGCLVDAPESGLEAIAELEHVSSADKGAIGRLVAQGPGTNATAATEAERWPSVTDFAGRTRAFLKVQDGCNAPCTYCIIPQTRGSLRSRPAGAILAEARRLVAAGYRELVLSGVHLGFYGCDVRGREARGRTPSDGQPGDDEQPTLARLVARLVTVPGLARLRLSSLEVQELGPELIALMRDSGVLVPHWHLPLQSGSDAVLARMKRRYRLDDLRARVAAVRAAVPDAAFSTDAIVGFPGETDADFEATCAALREVRFMRVHVFPFSPRPNTQAASYTQVPPAVREARRQALLALARELAHDFAESQVGSTQEVLFEHGPEPPEPRAAGEAPTTSGAPAGAGTHGTSPAPGGVTRGPAPGTWVGYTARYLRVHVPAPGESAPDCNRQPPSGGAPQQPLGGRILPVTITAAQDDHALGQLLSEQ